MFCHREPEIERAYFKMCQGELKLERMLQLFEKVRRSWAFPRPEFLKCGPVKQGRGATASASGLN